MLTQVHIDEKIAELEAEERSIMAGADAAPGRLDRVRAAIRVWRERKPTSASTIARIERIGRYREMVEADVSANNGEAEKIDEVFDRLLHNVGLDDPLAEDTVVAADIISLHQALTEADCSPDIVDALADIMAPGGRN